MLKLHPFITLTSRVGHEDLHSPLKGKTSNMRVSVSNAQIQYKKFFLKKSCKCSNQLSIHTVAVVMVVV